MGEKRVKSRSVYGWCWCPRWTVEQQEVNQARLGSRRGRCGGEEDFNGEAEISVGMASI